MRQTNSPLGSAGKHHRSFSHGLSAFFSPVVAALAADLLAQPFADNGVDALQRPIFGPPIKVVADGLPRPVLAGDLPPLAVSAFQVQQAVQNATAWNAWPPPSALWLRQQRLQHRPLGVGQVARIVNWDFGGLHASPPVDKLNCSPQLVRTAYAAAVPSLKNSQTCLSLRVNRYAEASLAQ